MNAKPVKKESPSQRPRILVVEDEQDLQEVLRYALAREGYQVICADTGEKALELARRESPNLILLDLMLPGVDGLNVCRTLKSQTETDAIPVIMVTAKGEEPDIVVGLELGADDYIVKPFSQRVLLARIKSVLRRGSASGTADRSNQPIKTGPLTIDRERHDAKLDGQSLDLTATEFRLLTLLAAKPGRVFTRQQIIESVHGGLAAVTDRSVDVQMVALRRKLGDHGAMLETVRGVGYRFKE
ncbi:MAG: response regulator transcription factor [Phycisphaeraceae bacterium]|nr:response regulator transcription factor [Phycisphaeraceae bacterium]